MLRLKGVVRSRLEVLLENTAVEVRFFGHRRVHREAKSGPLLLGVGHLSFAQIAQRLDENHLAGNVVAVGIEVGGLLGLLLRYLGLLCLFVVGPLLRLLRIST